MKNVKTRLLGIIAGILVLTSIISNNQTKQKSNKNLVDYNDIIVVKVYNPALEKDKYYIMKKDSHQEENVYNANEYDVARRYCSVFRGVTVDASLYNHYTWYEKDEKITTTKDLYLEDIGLHILYRSEETNSINKDNIDRSHEITSSFEYIVSILPLKEKEEFTISEDCVYGKGEEEYRIETYPLCYFTEEKYYTKEELIELQKELNKNSKQLTLLLKEAQKNN